MNHVLKLGGKMYIFIILFLLLLCAIGFIYLFIQFAKYCNKYEEEQYQKFKRRMSNEYNLKK